MKETTITILKADTGMWLYKDDNVNDKVVRTFASQVMNADDSWHECTDAEKTEWEEAHKPIDPPEPPHIEDTQADVVE